LFSDIETSERPEKWTFSKFGIGCVLGLSATGKGVRVLGEEFASIWSWVDGGRFVSHEEVTFVRRVIAVFHPIRV
jgi:hypothetical protein